MSAYCSDMFSGGATNMCVALSVHHRIVAAVRMYKTAPLSNKAVRSDDE